MTPGAGEPEKSGSGALIFNIQRFSVHDGPGIRDLVFLKGCPLRCRWCSNPESQHRRPEISYNSNRCTGSKECGYCIESCPEKAIHITRGRIRIDRSACNSCGRCVETCPAKALKLFGERMSVDDVIRIVEEDSIFYARSGGGITVSGGEPCQHAVFVENLLRQCRERGITTSIETTGYALWGDVARVCRHADLVLYDVKCMDAAKHKQHTGVSNAKILHNLRSLSEAFPGTPVVARTPIIPGFNDSSGDIEAIAEFLKTIPAVRKYELLAYHRFGESKYKHLGRRYPLQGGATLSEELMQECGAVASRFTQEREKSGSCLSEA